MFWQARHMVIPFMPMLVPPLNWTGYDVPAFLLSDDCFHKVLFSDHRWFSVYLLQGTTGSSLCIFELWTFIDGSLYIFEIFNCKPCPLFCFSLMAAFLSTDMIKVHICFCHLMLCAHMEQDSSVRQSRTLQGINYNLSLRYGFMTTFWVSECYVLTDSWHFPSKGFSHFSFLLFGVLYFAL